MIFAIAIRNLLQHRTKTLIIGLLVSVGITLTFAGNALIDSVIRNISEIFTEYYTGDVLITSTETLGAGVFGAQSDDVMGFPTIPIIRDFDQVTEIVDSTPGIESWARQISGYAMLNLEKEGADFSLFFGVNPEEYFKVMPDLEIVDGRMLKGDEEGMLLKYDTWKSLRDNKDVDIKIGDSIQLNSYGTAGMRIREVPVVGIYRFPRGNDRMFPMSFIDTKSLRYVLAGMGGKPEKVEVTKAATEYLDADLDSLFSDGSLIVDSSSIGPTVVDTPAVDASASRAAVTPGSGDWHFIVIKVKKGVNPDSVINSLNRAFDDRDLLARAQGWWVSAMPDSLTYSGLQLLFNVAIFILGFVSIIIIMNTLVVSVMERTSEIGTMRALGAQKSFVTKMFIAETGIITLTFGAIGLAVGALLILILNVVGIPTDNDALRYIGGGGILRPTVGMQPLTLSLVLMGIIALFSWIYPVRIALKVSPLKAIATE